MAFTGLEIVVNLRLNDAEFLNGLKQIYEAVLNTGNVISQNLNTSLSDLHKSLENNYTITNKNRRAINDLLVADEKFLALTEKLEKAGYKNSDALASQITRLIELYPEIKNDEKQLDLFKQTWNALDRAMKGNLKTFEDAASIFKELEEQTKDASEATATWRKATSELDAEEKEKREKLIKGINVAGKFADKMLKTGDVLTRLAGHLGRVISSGFNPWIIAIEAATFALSFLGKKKERVKVSMEDFEKSLGTFNDKLNITIERTKELADRFNSNLLGEYEKKMERAKEEIDTELAGYINEVYDLEAIACNLSVEKKDERKEFEEPFIQEFCTSKLAVNH
jgi:hypothetical protein